MDNTLHYTEESDIENLKIVNPIESMSKEQNEALLNITKQRLKKSNNWKTWEQFKTLAKNKFGI